jgi:alanine-glyoxylate transaminase/serine-glyoxylate transaminase/serine-pyruvate transaminase
MSAAASVLPAPRILLGPGPSSVSPRVLEALARAPIGYLDPELFEALEELQTNLRRVYGTANAFTLALTGTGMAGMEACFANLVEPGDTVAIGVHGFFGARMCEIAARYGANVLKVEAEWGHPLDPRKFRTAAEEVYQGGRGDGKLKLVACVHAETSTGVRQPLEPIAEIARESDALFLVDAVTSLGGLPVDIDAVGVDACYSGTQKCMGCPPGLSPLTVSQRAYTVATNRKTPVANWYYDWRLIRNYWDGEHAYHHTVPVNLLVAFNESLRQIVEEGLEERFARHQAVSAQLIEGLAELGIRPFAAEGYRLPTLNSVLIPDGVDDLAVRKQLLTEYGIEIGGGLGPLKGKIWRIGTMGESATPRNVTLLLGALRNILNGK